MKKNPFTKLLQAVVKVLTVSNAPDYEQPWQTHGPNLSTGSGAIIRTAKGLRVITNGHVVQNQVFVEVMRNGSSLKYVAEVEGVSHECDLALLRVPKEEFFEGAEPVAFGVLPSLGDSVVVCGYPVGGDRLSITQGVVSRIEVSAYAHSQRPLLSVQIDAAVNSGNSGGPVFENGKLIGIAFQSLEETQNIAYAIALPIVQHFLADLAEGRRAEFPSLGIIWQVLESDSHRRSLGLTRADGGIRVARVAFGSSAWGQLLPGDVLLAIEGEAIGADGTVQLRPGELVDHSHLVTVRHTGTPLRVTVWRDKRRLELVLELKRPALLCAEDQYDVEATYMVFGGLVFCPLSRDYLKSWGSDWWKSAPNELITIYENQIRTPERQEVVILQRVLADRINQGYHDFENDVVESVDGVPVQSLRHLVELLDKGSGQWLSVGIADGSVVVLDRKKAKDRGPAILDKFGLRWDRSADLRPRRARKPKG